MTRHRKPPRDPRRFDPTRRKFLAGMAGAAGTLALPGCGNSLDPETGRSANVRLPDPELSGIDHIVQVMMENRSYDHFLGWVPRSNGVQGGLRYKNINGEEVETFHLGSDPAYGYQGCGWGDPAHGYDAGRVHLNNGAMDGWLLTSPTSNNPADKFPVGYYTADDLLFYKGVAQHFTVCDRYFHGLLGSTFPNRIYIHAGATDRIPNDFYPGQSDGELPAPSELPTIWDQLAAKGLTGKNYFCDAPITAFWGDKYADIGAPFEQFLADAAAGQLSNVSYFDPFFGGAGVGETPAGVSRDDHPQADVRDGQVFLTQIYNALRASPNWERTLMIVTYDEWGGFYDRVVPPVVPVSEAEAALGNDGRLGFRVPCVILGPRARRGHVSHFQFDPNSVINLIRWRWGLDRVGDSPRNELSLNMALALDFDNPPNLDAPAFGDLGPDGLGDTRTLSWGRPCYEALPLVGGMLPSGLSPGEKSRLEHLAGLAPLYDMAKKYGLI
jgi:phospholipase C